MAQDISDFYIKNSKDPNFVEGKIETNSFIEGVISKIYMILLTNNGDTMDYEFGANIPKYLWSTNFSASSIQEQIKLQFIKYIPELNNTDYKINVYIIPGKVQDIGIININLNVANINILFK